MLLLLFYYYYYLCIFDCPVNRELNVHVQRSNVKATQAWLMKF